MSHHQPMLWEVEGEGCHPERRQLGCFSVHRKAQRALDFLCRALPPDGAWTDQNYTDPNWEALRAKGMEHRCEDNRVEIL